MAGEKVVAIAAKLYECRAAARFLFGDKYRETMATWGEALQEVASKTGQSVLQVAMATCQGAGDGMRTMVVMAAVVELMEPSA